MQIMQDAEHFVISNHVSLRKRTDSYCLEYCAREFQLASPQGDEHFSSFNLLRIVYFNSRLRKETNAPDSSTILQEIYFNSRLRKETNFTSSASVG